MSDDDVTIHPPPAEARATVGSVKLSVTMPTDWMLRGFELSVDRLRAAAAAEHTDARDLCIALFEMSNWLTSLTQRFPTLDESPHVKAVLFVRNRTHHQYAAPMFFDAADEAWTWYSVAVFPEPKDPKHRNARGERAYVQVAGNRPVLHTLDKIEVAVGRATGR